jgi:hypothetical protein
MKKYMIVGAALMVAGAANAALVSGASQRYVGGDFDGTTWTDTGTQGANATANGTFNAITVNGVAAVENTGAGVQMDFTRSTSLNGAGFTIQTVIRIDDGNTDRRQGPVAMADGGWGGVFMGARTEADGNINLRAGNQDSGSGSVLAIDDTMTGVTGGTWGIYTLLVSGADNPSMTATLTSIDGTVLFSATDDNGYSTDIGKINAAGGLFCGEYGQADADSWLGAIADVVVYDSALSAVDLATNAAEFQTLYAAIPEPATMGLVGVVGAGLLFVRRRFSI